MSEGTRNRWLDAIERLGNALPHPATLFALGALLVVFVSELAVLSQWSVERPGETAELLRAQSLLRSEGVYWAIRNLVKHFVNFAPLGVVLVGMLGIGVAERSGLIGAALKSVMVAVPAALLTPTMVFVGVLSSLGLDAGYVVLPPVAAALYASVGRSPLVGLAAVFAGVSGGFGANLVVTSLDPMLAELSSEGARLLDANYAVAASANWWFMIASTAMLTIVGWATTEWFVEPRYATKPESEGGPPDAGASAISDETTTLSADERRGLRAAGIAAALGAALLVTATLVPGAPLHGSDGPFPRWIAAIVPLLFLGFLVPGIAYGWAVGTIRSDKDVAEMMSETMSGMGGYIVLAFFAAQFIEAFRYTGLGEMLAISGGQALAAAALPNALLMVAFVGVVMLGNLFIGSMSAKYAFFAPVFVPMFMQVGISPELTQVAYRIGDSVTNVITPLNPYMVIVLVFVQRHAPRSGIGTLVSLMLPYTLCFAAAWLVMLIAWMATGFELGPQGPLDYRPAP